MAEQTESHIFINSILQPGEARPVLHGQTVDVGARRLIRRHKKSRLGCVACKLRKIKCDERQPCSGCLKRGIPCVSPTKKGIASRLARQTIDLGLDSKSQMSLLQLELFHHWDKHTRSTLVYPEIWPVVLQHALQQKFVMASVLCTSAMHLSTIHPEGKKYLNIANWLMPRSISLFRQSLSKPLTKNHAEAIVGAALLINYISWFDLSFLHDNVNAIDALAQDPLLLASSGITHAWFQTIPILIEGNSIFLKVMTRHPRLVIERFLARRDSSTNLFAQPLMDIWDDSRYQASSSVVTSTAVHEPANSLAWRLLQGLEREVLPAVAQQEQAMPPYNESERLQQYKEGITKITNTSISTDCQPATPEITPSSQARASFAYVVRRMSPLLHCQTLSSGLDLDIRNDLAAIQDDIEQLIYGFPILCCGPFTNLVQKRDTRALVLLLHLFRSALILLDTERCWWARTRAVTMGQLINSELKLRGLDTHVDKLHASNASFLSE